MEAILMVVWFE